MIGQSLDAHIELYVPDSWHDVASADADILDTLCIVSKATLASGITPTQAFTSETIPGLALVVQRALVRSVNGVGGIRKMGSVAANPTVCGRCGTCLQDI
jgi:hypothetical protein